MIKAVVERIYPATAVYGVENIRSPKYQPQHDGGQFGQMLENEKKKQAKDNEEAVTGVNIPDEYIQFVTYDMKAYMSWEIKNKFDITG